MPGTSKGAREVRQLEYQCKDCGEPIDRPGRCQRCLNERIMDEMDKERKTRLEKREEYE